MVYKIVKPERKQFLNHYSALYTLNKVLTEALKLLHPYMPFITEEIYKNLTSKKTIMIEEWPKYEESLGYEDDML